MTASISFVTSGLNGDSGLPDIRDKDLVEREAPLKALIEEVLPDFAKACREKSDVVVVHQDSFALECMSNTEKPAVSTRIINRFRAAPLQGFLNEDFICGQFGGYPQPSYKRTSAPLRTIAVNCRRATAEAVIVHKTKIQCGL
jgi:hypothetical protein